MQDKQRNCCSIATWWPTTCSVPKDLTDMMGCFSFDRHQAVELTGGGHGGGGLTGSGGARVQREAGGEAGGAGGQPVH